MIEFDVVTSFLEQSIADDSGSFRDLGLRSVEILSAAVDAKAFSIEADQHFLEQISVFVSVFYNSSDEEKLKMVTDIADRFDNREPIDILKDINRSVFAWIRAQSNAKDNDTTVEEIIRNKLQQIPLYYTDPKRALLEQLTQKNKNIDVEIARLQARKDENQREIDKLKGDAEQ